MVTMLRTEYVEIAGLIFATPAFVITDHSSLRDSAPTVGSDRGFPKVNGAKMGEHTYGASIRQLPVHIFGVDDDGDLYPDGAGLLDPRDGLTLNINRVNAALRPQPNGKLVKLHQRDESIIQGYAHFRTPLALRAKSPSWKVGMIEAVIPAGVLRSDTAIVADNSLGSPFDVANPGTADQMAVEIIASGAGTITNTTNGAELTITGAGEIEIHTSPLAFSITDAGGRADGRISDRSGFTNYFPLTAGVTNVIDVTGGIDVQIRHFPAY